MTPSAHALPAIVLAALMTACAAAPQGAPVPPADTPAQLLQAYDWDLAAAYDAQGQAEAGWRLDGRPGARLHFADRRLSVRNLCNALGADYALEGSRMRVGQPMLTRRACLDGALMALEQRVSAQLPHVQRFDLQGGSAARLALHFADGSRWELTGAPTPATRYGGAGERIFLEVAPERAACGPGAAQGAQCLRVREVRYSADGVKQGTGEWQIFDGQIEGYTHESGMRNILRVNRFKRQGAGTAAYAYVLDMVVESRREP
jgi:heat shock protein HslJ